MPNPVNRYTYRDYLQWDDGERWELIHGVPYNMSPAPSRIHQKVLGEIFGEFRDYLKDKSCEVYLAPFDVRLPSQDQADDTDNVVQPDISIICDPDKLDHKGCNGNPDLIVEVLSPSTAKHDRLRKFTLYEENGVQEYWIVDISNETVEVLSLNQGQYERVNVYGNEDEDEDEITSQLFDSFSLDLQTVFE
ncbi:Uma2 family endonuclease [Salicibibacter cibi]|uniref:Uma2 family endonuclease n=2 Tax=Salicibibacter cibi TaxID=2743001 RepID=A0A7T7CHB3_9BACI|nr:Uma2 family endonuclease [Salicibibacter cibi]